MMKTKYIWMRLKWSPRYPFSVLKLLLNIFLNSTCRCPSSFIWQVKPLALPWLIPLTLPLDQKCWSLKIFHNQTLTIVVISILFLEIVPPSIVLCKFIAVVHAWLILTTHPFLPWSNCRKKQSIQFNHRQKVNNKPWTCCPSVLAIMCCGAYLIRLTMTAMDWSRCQNSFCLL